jgi:hypothetical protein
MLMEADPRAGVNVSGLVHASGLGAPALVALHGPLFITTAQVEVT